jgi:hypothetical protein
MSRSFKTLLHRSARLRGRLMREEAADRPDTMTLLRLKALELRLRRRMGELLSRLAPMGRRVSLGI